ncbi:MAG: hypothetical protein ACTHMV_14405 [Chitinophagaceae bacterium]
MKFSPGNCISIKSNDFFFAGIVIIANPGQYEIVLSHFMDTTPPLPDHFINAKLLCASINMGEPPTLSLDVFTIDPAYADSSPDITIIHHLHLPSFSPAVGFYRIEDLLEINKYYNQAIGLRNGTIPPDPKDPMTMFTEKIFVPANEFFQQQPAQNLLPTVKLYRHSANAVDYLQIYGNSEEPTYLVIHWGRIGEKSLIRHIKDRPLQELQRLYSNYIEMQRTAGYQPAEHVNSLILQFKADDRWRGMADLDFRNEIWNELDGWLFWSGNGQVTGGDIGSGAINLFLDVIAPETAVQTIAAFLAKKKTDRPFIIAIQDEEGEASVIYPAKYKSKFFF